MLKRCEGRLWSGFRVGRSRGEGRVVRGPFMSDGLWRGGGGEVGLRAGVEEEA